MKQIVGVTRAAGRPIDCDWLRDNNGLTCSDLSAINASNVYNILLIYSGRVPSYF